MKKILIFLFITFLVWMIIGITLINQQHEKAEIVMGLGVLFLSFILMPLFIYYRYKDGKYKKYIINDQKLTEAFKNIKDS